METSSKILDKIKKLILKQMSAEQIGSTDEAEAFAAKVQELLAKHNLERGAIEFKDENAVGHEDMAIMFPVIGGSSALHILYPIAKYNWCQVYSVGKKSNNKMRLFGTPENREVCKYIFMIVAQALIKVCKAEYANHKENFQPNWKQSKPIGYDTYARTFMVGAGNGLDAKLRAERDTFRSQNQGVTGLVVANDRAVGEYVQNKYNVTKGRATKTDNSTDAFSKGKRAGQEVNITRGLNGGTNKDALRLK